MKTSVLLAILFAATPLLAEDITTLSGTKYLNVTVTRVEANGLSISHDDGLAKIPFTDLSEELRTKYSYDPKKAAQLSQVEQAAAAQRAAAANAAAGAKQKQEAMEKRIATEAKDLRLLVEQVLPNGVLADPMIGTYVSGRASRSASIGGGGGVGGGGGFSYSPSGKTIFVQGLTKLAEGDEVSVQAIPDGTHVYSGRTVAKWISIKRLDK